MAYSLDRIQEAIDTLRNSIEKKSNFTESVEVLLGLREIDLKDPSKRFNISIILPHPIREKTKLGVFAEGELAVSAKKLGLKVISKEEVETLVKDPKTAKNLASEYDFFVALAPLMPLVGRYWGKFLGPRGKMPKPIAPSTDLEKLLAQYNRTITLRLRTNPSINAKIGTINNSNKELAENTNSIISTLVNKLERGVQQIKKVSIKTTMGKAISI
ncbi:MAG: 50S ribosomal protein L1 [Promethearchaeota archaeon]